MTQQELQELSNRLNSLTNTLTKFTNASLVDTTLYLDNKEDSNRKECILNDLKRIDNTVEEFKISINQLKELTNI